MKINDLKLKEIIYTIGVLFLVIFSAYTLWIAFGPNLPGRVFSVDTGSMSPTITKGSLILISPQEIYEIGDIVTANVPDRTNTTYTHRIVGFIEQSGRTMIETKGDANDAVDSALITQEQINGKVTVTIPVLGYIASFANSRTGLILLVIIPALIIITLEVVNIKDQIRSMIKTSKSGSSENKKLLLSVLLIGVPLVILLSYVVIGKTNSFYKSEVKSFGNIISTPSSGEDHIEEEQKDETDKVEDVKGAETEMEIIQITEKELPTPSGHQVETFVYVTDNGNNDDQDEDENGDDYQSESNDNTVE